MLVDAPAEEHSHVTTPGLRSPFDHPPVVVTLLIPPLAATNDTSDSFRLIRVCGHALLLPRLVLDNPNPAHRRRDERPDHSTGSYAPANHNNALPLTTRVGVYL